jgi:hypothetical protein
MAIVAAAARDITVLIRRAFVRRAFVRFMTDPL